MTLGFKDTVVQPMKYETKYYFSKFKSLKSVTSLFNSIVSLCFSNVGILQSSILGLGLEGKGYFGNLLSLFIWLNSFSIFFTRVGMMLMFLELTRVF